ncbi:BtrH N-terminal domain-containing protein [Kaarinaea lacus]
MTQPAILQRDRMEMPLNGEFQHRHAAHCESGAMSSLLRHYGLDISEPMAFGLSSAMLFVHIPFLKVEGFPLTAYRAAPGTIIRALQKTLGVQMQKERFSDPQRGTERLDELLEQGRVVGTQASVYWLPYFPPDMRFHFNAHNMVVYGKQDKEYLVSDPVGERPVKCHQDDLEKARFVKGVFAPKGLLYYPTHVPESVDMERAIRKALRKASFQMLHIPLPIIGVKGIQNLAKRICVLEKSNPDPRYARLYIGFIVRMQEEIGTGGGGFRFLYASFLQEAAKLLSAERLNEASEVMTVAGDAWREFALLGARYCKKKSDIKLSELVDAMQRCAVKETEAFKLLKSIRL